MAKGNPIIGNQRGSIGDVTLSVYRGTQVAKKRNRAPRNPKTTPQMLQRMCMAQATKLAAFFSPFVDHSFQGKEYGGVSRNYFVKRAIERIRLAALQSYRGDEAEQNFEPAQFPYAVMAPVPFSEGSLQPLVYSGESNDNNVGVTLNFDSGTLSGDKWTCSARKLFEALGIPVDGQLTMISVKAVATQSVVGGYNVTGDTQMYIPAYSAIRLRIDPSYSRTAVLESGLDYSAEDLRDLGFLVETEGSAAEGSLFIRFNEQPSLVSIIYDWDFTDDVGQQAIAFVAVASLFEAKKWLRSSQDIMIIQKYPGNFTNALNSWIGSSVSLLNTDRLLNYEGLVNP